MGFVCGGMITDEFDIQKVVEFTKENGGEVVEFEEDISTTVGEEHVVTKKRCVFHRIEEGSEFADTDYIEFVNGEAIDIVTDGVLSVDEDVTHTSVYDGETDVSIVDGVIQFTNVSNDFTRVINVEIVGNVEL